MPVVSTASVTQYDIRREGPLPYNSTYNICQQYIPHWSPIYQDIGQGWNQQTLEIKVLL